MPLNVSDLPAGTLTVRLVRGAFNENLTGHLVQVNVAGGAPQRGTTDQEGRATFTVGTGVMVDASARVGNELLESQSFSMPASGGVRLLLVADGDVGSGAGKPALPGNLPPGHPPIDEPAVAVQDEAVGAGGWKSRIVIAGTMTVLTIAGAVLLTRRRLRFRRLAGLADEA